MKIALCGPVDVSRLRSRLSIGEDVAVPTGLGGTPVAQMAVALLERGHDVLVVTLDRHVDDIVRIVGPNVTIKFGPYRSRHRARDAFRVERRAIQRALADEDADVVHAHWSYEFALGALAARSSTIITVHDWAPTIMRMHRDPYRFVRLLMNIAVLTRAQHYSTVSPYMADRLSRWLRRDVPVIPNALDDALFDQPRQFPRQDVRFLAVSDGFDRSKNTRSLLRAFSLVRPAVPTARLLMVGRDHQEGGAAQRWAAEHRLAHSVTFVGPQSHAEVLTMMRDAHALVHPSLEESFGMVLIEAMSQGLPVIAGRDSGAVPWVLDDGAAGVLVDVHKPASIANAMSRLAEDSELWESLSVAGHLRAFRTFRASSVAETYVQLYESVIEQQRHRPASRRRTSS